MLDIPKCRTKRLAAADSGESQGRVARRAHWAQNQVRRLLHGTDGVGDSGTDFAVVQIRCQSIRQTPAIRAPHCGHSPARVNLAVV